MCSKAFNSRKPYSVRAAAFFSTRFVHYARVFLAADAVRNSCLMQIRQPFIANELPVSIEGFDIVKSAKIADVDTNLGEVRTS